MRPVSVHVDNHSGLPHRCVRKAAPDGRRLQVLVVRGSFDLDGGGVLRLSDRQSPVRTGDVLEGPASTRPLRATVGRAGDLAPYKPGTDVLVTGTARHGGARPQSDWLAGLALGPVRKVLRLTGPRSFRRGVFGWRLGDAEPVAGTPLDWRLAFGGSWTPDEGEVPGDHHLSKDDNPAGCGWLPGSAQLHRVPGAVRASITRAIDGLDTLPAPRIEHPSRAIGHPGQDLPAEGFGPVARWCGPRRRLAGCFDDTWRQTRHPALPEDFDPAFYQDAPADQVVPGHLSGDEPFRLVGMCPEGQVDGRLPGWTLLARARTRLGVSAGPMRLDTVEFDLDARRVGLVWRAAFPVDDALESVVVAAVPGTGGAHGQR